MPTTLTIKQLHAKTGLLVRQAGKARSPITITDSGRPVAVLASHASIKVRQRKRSLLPAYAALLQRPATGNTLDDLAAVRGDR